MKKLISLILSLVLVCSLLPMAASAKSWTEYPVIEWVDDGPFYGVTESGVKEKLSDAEAKIFAEFLGLEAPKKEAPVLIHEPNKHEYTGYGCDTKYHWLECACGTRISEELHVDPKDTDNDYCVCGYHFSSNADLVTLWINGCPGIKNFNKDTTEYTLNAYTYKDVKEIKISTRTHDSEATVELPEDLTLKEGENKFEIKVTSENQKVTKVYTVIVTKEAKK